MDLAATFFMFGAVVFFLWRRFALAGVFTALGVVLSLLERERSRARNGNGSANSTYKSKKGSTEYGVNKKVRDTKLAAGAPTERTAMTVEATIAAARRAGRRVMGGPLSGV